MYISPHYSLQFCGIVCVSLLGACQSPSTTPRADTSRALSVWNQAYQENTDADTISQITTQARDAYVLLDPFSDELGPEIANTVALQQANGNQVSAYISVGTGEDWRNDFAALQPYLVTKQWGEWDGEFFVSDPSGALGIMKARIDQIAAWGFDWVEFDNMDWVYDDDYRAEYGFSATVSEGVSYTRALCDYVHANGMKCMAKSTVDNSENFDGATYESYPDEQNWWDEQGAASFLAAGKPVVVVHYDEQDCAGVRADYQSIYGADVSFICEDPRVNGYVHF